MVGSLLMPGHLRPVAPIPVMLLGAAVSMLFVLLAATYTSDRAWLGLSFGFDEGAQHPLITGIHTPDLVGQVRTGNIVRAVGTEDGTQQLDLSGFVPGVEPPSFSTYQGHNAYLRREGAIAGVLGTDKVRFELLDGQSVTVNMLPNRPWRHLPLDFWLFNLFGLLAFNISLAVFAVRPRVTSARLLLLSGLGFYTATLFNSIYLSREFALPEPVFLALSRLNHVGLSVMLAALLALMAYFPKKIGRTPLWVIFPIAVLVQLNEWHQWYQWPLHTYYLPIFIMYLVGVWIAIYQWRLSRSEPLDRAALKWMLLAIFIIMGLGLSIYFIPIALRGSAIFPQWAMVGIASLLYVGFAFGIVRYRLFDVQWWWLKIWGWFLGGVAIVALDLVLIGALNMQPLVALSAAVIMVGWIYFPVRQWLLGRLARNAGTNDRRLLDQVEKIARTTPNRDSGSQWQQVLVNQYSPAGIDFDRQTTDTVHLERQGAVLAVPTVTGEGTLRLTYRDYGQRLFSMADVDYVQSLLQISRRILAVHAVEMQAVEDERQRIVRDLHDDVGGHLLTLLRQAPTERYSSLTRNALQALREAMKAMDSDAQQRLIDCLDDWRLELEQRVNDNRINFVWRQDLDDTNTKITVRQAININRIISESVSNALQHAEPTSITVTVSVNGQGISLRTENDGVRSVYDGQDVMRGRGLNNMRTRATELGGTFQFRIESGLAIAIAGIPLGQITD